MIEIIPAIDVIDGKCVRLSQGDYAQKKVYNENPLEIALQFEAEGIRRLHLVDLDGAKAQHIVNHAVLERIASHTHLVIDFGGGLKSDDDVRIAFESGAAMVTGGSVAVKKPGLFTAWMERYGAEKIILGADVQHEQIAISGWMEKTNLDLIPFIEQYVNKGIHHVLCTDIARDGMLEGPSIALYQKILAHFPALHLIASGGVSGMEDIDALSEAGVPAVVFGKAIYEGRIQLKDLRKYL
ncbi:1-(5-phosphoribosyl)-5-[(5-phosphoribosylamino)methylideneamino]imidazole-4-carboxamide isomerase [Microbacter margulisiae]|uniref:1-(5-phosphoribosyl)-5-[(5-phosphoribosylamino)methylideneamino] imidazole-4-carboxamide isomerase n=1 Tax=Microbacter margulisiae TaxID=1350067 RepID=A0A7W5H2E4_9PORP|nr:1-(5-phosphoribosyl)-5-[(5-phosphoribosylamino)methylideneamino]imidazole-4-carboxamide isomerase [Microbacter margulisiae]MBB3188583.1 phosphoribosylformimino-5-aminoimidazole carboxamide ribotide isomerase [Microbacter margulisiae]